MPRYYQPGPNINKKLARLKEAVIHDLPYCSGTVPVSSDDLQVFYAKSIDGGGLSIGHIDPSNATDLDLKRLSDACDPATFGRNNANVLDPSYRNARKLDPVHFSSKLNIAHAGVMESIHYNLLGARDAHDLTSFRYKHFYGSFYAELYKLNLYGKGSFFKSHKDTPRSEKMFGSLVIALPTPHEGGALVLRKGKQTWRFDTDKTAPLSISYVAFFGDVEHEVLEVTSGYRLTLTYNLYFGESLDSQAIHSSQSWTSKPLLNSLPPNAATFENVLSQLLGDSKFLPLGGLLGFGLHHEYPVPKDKRKDLTYIMEVLKGSDATIARACRSLGLEHSLYFSYSKDNKAVLCNSLPDTTKILEEDIEEKSLVEYLADYQSGVMVVNSDEMKCGDDAIMDLDSYWYQPPPMESFVHWVTEPTSNNEILSHHIAFGNEATLAYDYGRVCLIVNVGPAGKREAKRISPPQPEDEKEDKGDDSDEDEDEDDSMDVGN